MTGDRKVSRRLTAKRSMELFNRYANTLMQILYMDNVVWLVFFYLFERKVYARKPAHSAYGICKSLNVILQSNPPILGGPMRLSDKSVSEALETLAARVFVIKREVKGRKRGAKRTGRPPKYVYEVESMANIVARVKEEFQDKEERAFHILNALQDAEEAAGSEMEELE